MQPFISVAMSIIPKADFLTDAMLMESDALKEGSSTSTLPAEIGGNLFDNNTQSKLKCRYLNGKRASLKNKTCMVQLA